MSRRCVSYAASCDPGGFAPLQHPVDPDLERTSEDASITSPTDRLRAFGQEDHVRAYGRDFTDRLETAGFTVAVRQYEYELSEAERERFGLLAAPRLEWSTIHVCR